MASFLLSLVVVLAVAFLGTLVIEWLARWLARLYRS